LAEEEDKDWKQNNLLLHFSLENCLTVLAVYVSFFVKGLAPRVFNWNEGTYTRDYLARQRLCARQQLNQLDKDFLGNKVLINQIITRVMSKTKINIT
jgi:hypothetical protein